MPKLRWWDCHASWTVPKTGASADILFFVQATTMDGAVRLAQGWLACLNEGLLRAKSLKIKVRLAKDGAGREYQPGSKSHHWHVQRGPWVPSPGAR